ncbi:NUDIX hydrolase [Spiractinospora alimapuensis]|uniref:NUDIX hydrolase n=1 Tax=Spiractinospora alimapuensis TaxID=2820884 RepID=UPI001F2DB119|nr:NUDIX hydrolase [Spiractinospora alimapuensis]QVQ50369.1 NUDIX hydrolase [Spiractinospora alimapuensis]
MTDGASWRNAVLAGHTDPVAPRDSATVILLRPGVGGAFQVCLLRRAATMRVGAGLYVFPGGAVDAEDVDDARACLPWIGAQPERWAAWFGVSREHAASFVYSAVRETFEESGVLLAGPATHPLDGPSARPEGAATGLPPVDRSFAAMLAHRGLTVRADLLRPWSRWVTPRTERKRFDTRFFVAVVPPDQEPRVASPESDRLVWMTPAEAVDHWDAGGLPMALPTSETLRELAELSRTATLDTILELRRDLHPVEPAVRRRANDSVVLVAPDGREYQPPRIAR